MSGEDEWPSSEAKRSVVTVAVHQPYKCGYHATATAPDGRSVVARGDFGAGYPTKALARRAALRILRNSKN